MKLIHRVIHSHLEANADKDFDGQIIVGFKGATLADVTRLWEIVTWFLKALRDEAEATQDS